MPFNPFDRGSFIYHADPIERSPLTDEHLTVHLTHAVSIAREQAWTVGFGIPEEERPRLSWFTQTEQEAAIFRQDNATPQLRSFRIFARSLRLDRQYGTKPGIHSGFEFRQYINSRGPMLMLYLDYHIDSMHRIGSATLKIVGGYAPWDPELTVSLYPNTMVIESSIQERFFKPILSKLTLQSSFGIANAIASKQLANLDCSRLPATHVATILSDTLS